MEEACMDCIEAIARLHLYIDRELSFQEVSIVQQHLTACPDCEGRFHFDIQIKRLIHERCTIERAPAHLREAVLQLARTPGRRHAERQRGPEPIDLDPELEMELRADVDEYV